MIFCLLEDDKRKIGNYKVDKSNKINRLIIRLSNDKRIILEIIEDCFGEWIIKEIGNEDDLIEFTIEHIIHILCYKLKGDAT